MFWNIRSVNTQNAFERLTDLNKIHYYSFMALIEPFMELEVIDQYK